jgi:HEAT repeat protein
MTRCSASATKPSNKRGQNREFLEIRDFDLAYLKPGGNRLRRLFAFDPAQRSVISCPYTSLDALRAFPLSDETADMLRTFCCSALLTAIFFLSLAGPARSEDDEILGKKKAEWLIILEKHEKPELRKAAVIALGIIGPGKKDILPVLVKALDKDKDDGVKLQIVSILGNLEAKELRDTLETLADVLKKKSESAAVKAGAATVIGKIGLSAKPALSTLIAALKEPDASVKAAAVEAIGRIGPEAAKPAMVEMLPLLKNPELSVRFATIYAFSRLGPEAVFVVPDLNQVLESDASADVRQEAAKTIGMFGPAAGKFGVPALVKALREDKSEEVRRKAATALGKMGAEIKPAVATMKEAMRKDSDRTVRLHLVRALSSALGNDLKDLVKDLAECLGKEPDGDVRLAIIQELGALGPPAKEAVKALRDAESDLILQVREAARMALKQIEPPKKKEEPKKDEKK